VKPSSLLLVASVLALSGCAPLRRAVNNKFPPINENQQRQIAVDSTAKALSAIKTPTILAGVNLSDAGQVLLNEDLHKLGVTKLSLVGMQQLLKISLEFNHKFSAGDAGENADARKFITTWRPEASGSISVFAGLKNPDVNAINLADIPAMDLQLFTGAFDGPDKPFKGFRPLQSNAARSAVSGAAKRVQGQRLRCPIPKQVSKHFDSGGCQKAP